MKGPKRLRFATLVALSLVQAASAQTMLVRDGYVVDPRSRTVRHASLIVRDGHIAEVVRRAPEHFRGTVIDAKGRWVIPGLVDMHVHAFGNPSAGSVPIQFVGIEGAAKLLLYAGVTSFLDLFNDEEEIFALRNKQRAGKLEGSEIYAAGPMFTAPGGHGTEYGTPTRVVKTPEEARHELAELAKRTPDVIKIVYDHGGPLPTLDSATMRALIVAAQERGYKTVVHIGTWDDAAAAVLAGASAVTHFGDGEIPDSVVTQMRERGTAMIPTLAANVDILRLLRHPEDLSLPLMKALVLVNIRDTYLDSMRMNAPAKRRLQAAHLREDWSRRSLRKLADAGVPILVGTDAGNISTFLGFSVHREMEIMVEMGLSPWDALAAATTEAGKFLRIGGGVDVGDTANLVILSASPVENIRNTQRIVLVIKAGRVVARSTLRARAARP